jgi:ribonuclease-3 family protein
MRDTPFSMETDLFSFPPAKEPKLLGPIVLAYIGDAVYEIFIRQYVISMANQRPNHLHKLSTQFVSARAQAKALHNLMPLLTDEETDVVKRGRNAKSGSSAKNADILEYRHSTAFECLLGYLYYTKQMDRLQFLMMQTLELDNK